MFATVRKALQGRRGLLSRVALVLFGLGVVLLVHRASPGDANLEFALGDAHRSVVEVRIAYVQEGETVRGASFRYPDGAPRTIPHTAHLGPGDYEVHVTLLLADGKTRQVTRSLTVPTEGRTRLIL